MPSHLHFTECSSLLWEHRCKTLLVDTEGCSSESSTKTGSCFCTAKCFSLILVFRDLFHREVNVRDRSEGRNLWNPPQCHAWHFFILQGTVCSCYCSYHFLAHLWHSKTRIPPADLLWWACDVYSLDVYILQVSNKSEYLFWIFLILSLMSQKLFPCLGLSSVTVKENSLKPEFKLVRVQWCVSLWRKAILLWHLGKHSWGCMSNCLLIVREAISCPLYQQSCGWERVCFQSVNASLSRLLFASHPQQAYHSFQNVGL